MANRSICCVSRYGMLCDVSPEGAVKFVDLVAQYQQIKSEVDAAMARVAWPFQNSTPGIRSG